MLTVKKKITIVLFILLCLIMAYLSPFFVFRSYAQNKYHSDVLDDLSKDSSFSTDDYIPDSTDTDLRVIQVAEGENDEIFIYVFNPAYKKHDLRAAKINMSLQDPTERDIKYSLYDLTWINTNGAFSKYVVNNLNVQDKVNRYYTIATVYRPHDSTIDAPAVDDDDFVDYEGMSVGRSWKAYYYNGKMVYESARMDFADVRIHSVGHTSYSNGFHLYYDACYSHFVAFSVSNFDIDRVYDATVRYSYSDVLETVVPGQHTYEASDPITIEADVKHNDTGSNDPDGWFGNYKYTWNRIVETKTFIQEIEDQTNEFLTPEYEEGLQSSQYVIRFLETPTVTTVSSTSSVSSYTRVTEVTILRLKFLVENRTYNLGVVADIVSDDGNPDFVVDLADNIQNGFEDVFLILVIIGLIVLFILFKDVIIKFLEIVFSGIATIFNSFIYVLKLPFRFFMWFFK